MARQDQARLRQGSAAAGSERADGRAPRPDGRDPGPTAAILDSRTLRSTRESGPRAGSDGHKRPKGSEAHAAVDTLGHLLALHVTPAGVQDRDRVAALAEAVPEATGDSVDPA